MERGEALLGPEWADRGPAVEVDLGLVESTLAMTVVERLRLNDRTIRSIAKLRAGFAKLRAEGHPLGPSGRER